MASSKGVVRDLFTLGVDDRGLLNQVVRRGEELGFSLNKSEVVRAGIRALATMPIDKFRSAITIERFRPGPNPRSEGGSDESEDRESLVTRLRQELGLD